MCDCVTCVTCVIMCGMIGCEGQGIGIMEEGRVNFAACTCLVWWAFHSGRLVTLVLGMVTVTPLTLPLAAARLATHVAVLAA